jgi:hypothetical protein
MESGGGGLIYWSKNGSGINLNGKANTAKGREIWCRDLSYYVASREQPIKNFQQALKTIDSIESVPSLKEGWFHKNRPDLNSCDYSLVPIESLGDILKIKAEKIKRYESSAYLLESESHAMAVSLQHKMTDEGRAQYIIKFYDPNYTDRYQRIICSNLDEIKTICFSDIFPLERQRQYFPKLKSFMFYSVNLRKIKNKCDFYIFPTMITSERLYLLSAYGLTAPFAHLLKEILSSNADEKIKKAALSTKYNDGVTGFHMAFEEGHSEIVGIITDQILSSNLSENLKMELLIAQSYDGVPGFFMTLQAGHTEAAGMFIEKILSSNLSEEAKIELLRAESNDGIPGFHLAFYEGHTETVEKFTALILSSHLSEDAKYTLLNAREINGLSGYQAAIQENKKDTANQFYRYISLSTMDVIVKNKLCPKILNQYLGINTSAPSKSIETKVLPQESPGACICM